MNSRFPSLQDEHVSKAVQGIWQHLSEAIQTDPQLRDYVRDVAVFMMCSAIQQPSVDSEQTTLCSSPNNNMTVLTTDSEERSATSIDAAQTVADLKPMVQTAVEADKPKQPESSKESTDDPIDDPIEGSVVWPTEPSDEAVDEEVAEAKKAQQETTSASLDVDADIAPAPIQVEDSPKAAPTPSPVLESEACAEPEAPQASVEEMMKKLKSSLETGITGPARTPVSETKLVPHVPNNGSAKKHRKEEEVSVATTERHEMTRKLLSRASFTKMATHCRLKADTALSRFEQSKFTIEQLRRIDKQLDKRAKKLGVKLWLRYTNLDATDEEWKQLASAFELRIEGLDLLNHLEDVYPIHEDMLGRTLPLLYRIVQTVGHTVDQLANRGDQDVIDIRSWLTEASRETGIEANGLKGNPNVEECRDSLKKMKSELSKRKKCNKQLSKLKWESNKILDFVSDDQTPDWSTFNRTVNDLVNMGEPASSKTLRLHLEAVRYFIPSDLTLSPGLQQAIKFYDSAEEKNAEHEAQAKLAKDKDYASPRVLKVRELLKGKQITIVGGDATPEKIARITKAFQLSKLEWVTTHHHTHINKIIPIVARPENAAVLLLIRWASHVYNELGSHAKVFVKVTAGYNPNQLAEAILTQASDRL